MKLHIVDRERHYELTYLVSPSLTSDELSKLREKVKAIITKYKGEVLEVIDWGRKTLEYPIKHEGKTYNEAVYTHSVIMLPSTDVTGFDRDMRLNTSVIRHLLVIAEEAKSKAEKPAVATQSAPAAKMAPAIKSAPAPQSAPAEKTVATEMPVNAEKSDLTKKKAPAKPKTTRSKKLTEEQTAS